MAEFPFPPSLGDYLKACERAQTKGKEILFKEERKFDSTYYFFLGGDWKTLKMFVDGKLQVDISQKVWKAFKDIFEELLKESDSMNDIQKLMCSLLPEKLKDDERHINLTFSREYLIKIRDRIEEFSRFDKKEQKERKLNFIRELLTESKIKIGDVECYFPLSKKNNAYLLAYFLFRPDVCLDAIKTFLGETS